MGWFNHQLVNHLHGSSWDDPRPPQNIPRLEAFQTAKGERPGSLEMLWDFAKESAGFS